MSEKPVIIHISDTVIRIHDEKETTTVGMFCTKPMTGPTVEYVRKDISDRAIDIMKNLAGFANTDTAENEQSQDDMRAFIAEYGELK